MPSTTHSVDTKSAPKRSLQFASLDEVSADLDGLEAAMHAGGLEHTGNWTPGQIFDHLARFFIGALDGFDRSAPAPVRFIARMLLKDRATASDEPFPAGFKLPKSASALFPQPGISDADGLEKLRLQIARVEGGERMEHPSPLIGKLEHEEWLIMQLKHCALHLGFVRPAAHHDSAANDDLATEPQAGA
ncbi:MAG: DUF1569 domain-containing protein [Planctomycetota bacterium]